MDTPSTPSSLDPVGLLLDEFLSGGELGDEAFERFIARHPAHAAELRGLHAAWSGVLAALPDAGDRAGEPWAGVVPAAGMVLGGFRLIRLLGEGGMGRVWEAEQIALGRRVALKLVRPGLEPGGLHRLWREARAAGRINHRGIVPVFEVGEIEGQPFIVEQLVGDGTTLADLIERGRAGRRPDPREVTSRFVEIAEALQAAHDEGILHGDIKPQNILIDTAGRPRVSDFGLAHVRDDGEVGHRLRGTVAYMSPEQATGSGPVDARSDVFSLGAVLYEALTLERALPGATTAEVLERQRTGSPVPPRALAPRVSRDLSAVCLRALARDPAARYASLAEFAEDLQRVLRHEPTRARPVGPTLRAAKWARRHQAKAVAIVATAVLVATLGAMLVREAGLRKVAESQARDARRRQYVASLKTAQIRLEQGQPVEARRRLDDCAADLRDWEWELLSSEAGSSVLVLEGHPPGSLAVAVSAAGDRIVTAAADGVLRAFDGASGAVQASVRVSDAALGSAALAGDGHTVACGTADGRVEVVDLDRRLTLAELTGHTGVVTSVAISNDGRRVVSRAQDYTVRFWNGPDAKESEPVPFLNFGIAAVTASLDGSVVVTSSRYGSVSAWSGSDGAFLAEVQLNRGFEGDSVVAVDDAGTRVAAGFTDGHARVWDVATGELVLDTLAYTTAVTSITLSGDGRRLATAPSGEGPVRVWDVEGGALLESHAGHRGRITSLSSTRSGERIVAGCEDGAAYVWDQQVTRLPQHWDSSGFVGRALAASADGTTVVASATADRRLRAWRDGQDLALDPASTFVHSVAVDGPGALIVAGLGNGSLALWSPPDPRVSRVLKLDSQPIEALALSADATRAVAAAGHDLLSVELTSGAVTRWTGHTGSITRVVAAADLSRLATASTDGSVRLWDPTSGGSRVLLEDGPYVDHVLAMDAAGRWLAVSPSDGGRLHLYDLQQEPVERARVVTPRGGVPCLAFVSDGRRLVSSSTTSPRINLRDSESGEELVDLAGDSAGLFGLESGGSRRLFGLAADGSLRVWDGDRR